MTTGELAGEEGVDSQADVLPASVTKEEEEIHLDSAKEVASKDPGKADLDENWAKLTDYIRAQNPILGSFLRYGRLLHLDDEEIEIGFEKDSFYLEKMSEEDNRKLCEEVCRNFFKKELKLVFKDVTGETRSAGADKGKIEEPTDRERHLKKEAMENPVIQEAVKIFNGTIEKIKTGPGFKS
jgi:hypothetical protein